MPRLENTAPKKFKAAHNNIIRTTTSNILIKASWNSVGIKFRYSMLKTIEPNAPHAAASAGVAQPSRMEPSARAIRIVAGTKPKKNFFHRSEKKDPPRFKARDA